MNSREAAVNPYRRFTIVLGASVMLFAAVLAVAVILLIQRFVFQETVALTRAAVEKHFAVLPELQAVFSGIAAERDSGVVDASSGTGGRTYDGYNGNGDYGGGSVYGGTDDTGVPSSAEYEGLKANVQMHFDLYSVTETRFYHPDGTIAFSYHKEEVGRPAAHGKQWDDFERTIQGDILHGRMPDHLLHLWIPILGTDGRPAGAVEMVRDISEQDRQIRIVQYTLLALIVLGMLMLFFSLRGIFIRFAKTIAKQNRQLNELVRTIERTYDESLQALSSALDSRDNETQGHSWRVTAYSVLLGRYMGLDEKDLSNLARGALLHDVGKIGVPDAILLKPGKLTDEEWAVMREHVNIGYQMLRHIEFLQPSLDVVRSHHERWDGKGYPDGLAGEKIPLFACIFAVCDTFDAMTSDRPYRKGKSYEEAREEIARCSGTQFHPEVVRTFLSIPKEVWMQVREQSPKGKPVQALDDLLHRDVAANI